MDNQRYIYIVFSSTSSKMGKFIRRMAGYNFNHVSYSLESSLESLFSFARLYENVPLYGGFVKESALRYCTGANAPTNMKIFRIPISEEVYTLVNAQSEGWLASNNFRYNLFSAALVPLKKKIHIKDSYTCIEFVIKLLSDYNILDNISENNFYSFEDFDNILAPYIFKSDYLANAADKDNWNGDTFPNRKSRIAYISLTFNAFFSLLLRFFS